MRVKLSTTELMVAAYVGSARNVQSHAQAWTPHAGIGEADTWTVNIEGVAGEMAVAKALNLYWVPVVGNHRADDVGEYQVRTNMSRRLDDLCLRARDREDRIYISVLSFFPEFEVVGWITGQEGKDPQWLRDGTPGRPPCYYVPRTALHPLADLLALNLTPECPQCGTLSCEHTR